MSGYEVVIGLEVHAQLLTRSKMFCWCPADYTSAAPNENTCPVCLGLPGVLPTINQQAVEYTVRTALALHCDIPAFTKFDRKNYFYPDLPKGYQISQYDLPLSVNGFLAFPLGGETVRCGITRVHLEEDTGTMHHAGDVLQSATSSLIDLNRSGVPLMEIVGEPDLPPLRPDAAFVERVRATLPELPEARAHRFQQEYGLTAYDAAVLTDTREEADTYESLVGAGVPAKLAANWQSGDVAALANEHRMPLQHSGLGVDGLASLLRLVDAGTINGPTAKELLAELYVGGGNPESLVRDRGLAQVSDTTELTALVDAAIAANPAAAADFRAGKQQALGQLMRAVKDATGGKADMPLVNRLLRDRLTGQ